jgi:ERCC4-type nuclease
MKRVLTPEMVTAIVDTREQRPLVLSPLRVERATLDTGDYSVKGLESYCAIERKSVGDLVMCVTRERERFERACQRLLAYPVRGIIIEGATWSSLEAGIWRGKASPNSVCGSLLGWMAMGLPILLAQDAQMASRQVGRMLFIAARRRYRELLAFHDSVDK